MRARAAAAGIGRPGARIGGIDSMRAIAALAVFFAHLVAYWGLQGRLPGKMTQLSEVGAKGVDLFVVISGFCLALPVARAGVNKKFAVRRFFVRRAFRILPAYYLALIACAVLAIVPVTWPYVVAHQASSFDVLDHVFLVQSLFPGHIGKINGSFWSIALEVQLYLLFPLLVLAWRRAGFAKTILVVALLSIAWSTTGQAHWWILGDNHVLPARLIEFVVGAAAAATFVSGQVPRKALLWFGVIGGGVLATLATIENVVVGDAVLWSIPSASAVLLASGH